MLFPAQLQCQQQKLGAEGHCPPDLLPPAAPACLHHSIQFFYLYCSRDLGWMMHVLTGVCVCNTQTVHGKSRSMQMCIGVSLTCTITSCCTQLLSSCQMRMRTAYLVLPEAAVLHLSPCAASLNPALPCCEHAQHSQAFDLQQSSDEVLH